MHHFKPPDRRISGLQRLETWHGTDPLLQLAMIGLDDIVQIFNLSMHRFRRAFAFGLQLGNRDTVGRRFVRVEDLRLPILERNNVDTLTPKSPGESLRLLQHSKHSPEITPRLLEVLKSMNAAAHGVDINPDEAEEEIQVGTQFLKAIEE